MRRIRVGDSPGEVIMQVNVGVKTKKKRRWLDRVGLLLNECRYLEGLTQKRFVYIECNNFILNILRRVSNLDILFTCIRRVEEPCFLLIYHK